jgi:hypothetical protein
LGNREINKEVRSTQGKAQIRSLSILSPCLRDGLETSLAQKGHKKLKENGVAGGG